MGEGGELEEAYAAVDAAKELAVAGCAGWWGRRPIDGPERERVRFKNNRRLGVPIGPEREEKQNYIDGVI